MTGCEENPDMIKPKLSGTRDQSGPIDVGPASQRLPGAVRLTVPSTKTTENRAIRRRRMSAGRRHGNMEAGDANSLSVEMIPMTEMGESRFKGKKTVGKMMTKPIALYAAGGQPPTIA